MNYRKSRSQSGASLVEYALLLGLIAVVAITAVTFLGTSASTKFQEVGEVIQDAPNPGGPVVGPGPAPAPVLGGGARP
jgi:pilus assembly protein Flp/PilA